MKVFVYWNVRSKVWSVKALEGPEKGRVMFHRKQVILADVVGKVSEAGRQRVLRERRKNVHAGLVGTLKTGPQHGVAGAIEWVGDRITYNPYKNKTFVHVLDGSEYEGSAYAYLDRYRSVYVA
jgi:hypothetical protein